MSPLTLISDSPAPWLSVEAGIWLVFMLERGWKLHFFRKGEIVAACSDRVRVEEAEDSSSIAAGERPVACRLCVDFWRMG